MSLSLLVGTTEVRLPWIHWRASICLLGWHSQAICTSILVSLEYLQLLQISNDRNILFKIDCLTADFRRLRRDCAYVQSYQRQSLSYSIIQCWTGEYLFRPETADLLLRIHA